MDVIDWHFDITSFLFGMAAMLIVVGVLSSIYLATRKDTSGAPYAGFEPEEPQSDERPLVEPEKSAEPVPGPVEQQHARVFDALGPPIESIRLGKVSEVLHSYDPKIWDRQMFCVGATCNSAPFLEGHGFYEIPVLNAPNGTVLLVCEDCVEADSMIVGTV